MPMTLGLPSRKGLPVDSHVASCRTMEHMQETISLRDRPNGVEEEYAVISDPHHPIVRRINDVLRSRASRPKTILIDDIENIDQAARTGVRLDSLYLTQGIRLSSRDDSISKYRPVPTYTLSRAIIDGLFGGEKRARIFALAEAPRVARLDDLSARDGDIVVLDGVRLVGNIGAITRTSAGFSAAGLVLLESGLWNVFDRRLIRASRGLVFALPVVLATADEFAEYVLRERISVGTLAANATESLESVHRIRWRMALVLGSERSGLSEELNGIASYKYSIPMSPDLESLNVSVSAGIALYERSRTGQVPHMSDASEASKKPLPRAPKDVAVDVR